MSRPFDDGSSFLHDCNPQKKLERGADAGRSRRGFMIGERMAEIESKKA
jgi:hypothetical protein